MFAFTDDQWVTRCDDSDEYDPVARFHLDPRSGTFSLRSTGAVSVVVPSGLMTFVPGRELQGADGFTAWYCRTDAAAPNQPNNSDYTRQPAFPEQIPMTQVPYIAGDGGIADFGPRETRSSR